MIKNMFMFIFLTMFSVLTFAQAKEEQAVAGVVEKLRKAMVDADKSTLEALVADKLSYGHSTGAIEDKKLFVDNIISGKSDFVSMDLTNQTISISGNNAIVRHKLDGVTNNDGKPGEAHLLVLMVWQKKDGKWILLARQAVKQPVDSAATH
jgi:ketosteroid isomerase-like protein